MQEATQFVLPSLAVHTQWNEDIENFKWGSIPWYLNQLSEDTSFEFKGILII